MVLNSLSLISLSVLFLSFQIVQLQKRWNTTILSSMLVESENLAGGLLWRNTGIAASRTVKMCKLKIHIQAVYMKEERLHHGQCQRRLIVRGYTSGNCMKERCTLMPVATITDASSLYGGAWCLVTCVGRGRTLNKRPWAATATKGHCGSSSPLLVLF